MRRIKEATVYLKNKVAGKTLAAGAGFVIEVMGDSVLLGDEPATSRCSTFPSCPRALRHPEANRRSKPFSRAARGRGTSKPCPRGSSPPTRPTTSATDLAFLLVKGVKRPPAPINMLNRLDPTEGMAYLARGLSGSAACRARSSTERAIHRSRSFAERIAALGAMSTASSSPFNSTRHSTPGDSGGPIVEERTGTLIGVCVSRREKTDRFIGVAVTKLGSVDPIAI